MSETPPPIHAPAGQSPSGNEPVVLYRCRIPTNFLCPCGTVARRLNKHGVEHRTERVAWRKADRPEVAELTGGHRQVPVLIHGSEVVSDSKRIIQYLDWKRGE